MKRSAKVKPLRAKELDVFWLVEDDLLTRNYKGWKQHRKPLMTTDPLDWLKELYEELLDACVYLRGELARREGK